MSGNSSDPRKSFSGSAGKYLASTDHRSGPDLEVIRLVASQLLPLVTVDVAAGAGHALRAASPFSGSGIAVDLLLIINQREKKQGEDRVIDDSS